MPRLPNRAQLKYVKTGSLDTHCYSLLTRFCHACNNFRIYEIYF